MYITIKPNISKNEPFLSKKYQKLAKLSQIQAIKTILRCKKDQNRYVYILKKERMEDN